MPRAPKTTKAVDHKEDAVALLEKEAVRFAESLDDYEHVSVADIGGWGPHGFWLVVRDERFDISYEIDSHYDYWDLISAVEGSSPALGCLLRRQEQDQTGGNPLSICVRNQVLARLGRSSRRKTDRRRNQKEAA
jgi:hypothetical protein